MPAAVKTRKLGIDTVTQKADECISAQLQIVALKARADADCADIKARLADACAEYQAIIHAAEPDVIAYLVAHRDELANAKKQSINTELGAIGVRMCSDVVIDDQNAVIEFARENAYNDLYTEKEVVVSKTAIRKRLKRGESVPGARIDTAYEPYWKPDKTLVDKAKTTQ